MNSYPDQTLCFWLGFLPAGIWVALLAAGVDSCLNALTGEVSVSSVFCVFFQSIFLYGAPAALFAQFLGYWVRNVRPHSPYRWVWLSLLIPTCTFLLAGIQVDVVNMIECRHLTFEHDPGDIMIALCVYQCAALVSGVLALGVIGLGKLICRFAELPQPQQFF